MPDRPDLGVEVDLVAEYPDNGVVVNGTRFDRVRCTRCHELVIGVHGEPHWRVVAADEKSTTLRKCRDAEKTGVLKRAKLKERA